MLTILWRFGITLNQEIKTCYTSYIRYHRKNNIAQLFLCSQLREKGTL